jgi:hypothetical protein
VPALFYTKRVASSGRRGFRQDLIMKNTLIVASLIATSLVTAPAFAAPLQGATCWAGSNNTSPPLVCSGDLKGITSIKQLYEAGWRVVATAQIQLGVLFVVESQEPSK